MSFLDEKYILVSVIGPHAGESEREILKRKIEEIEKAGKTFWLYKSYGAKPGMVQGLCKRAIKERLTPFCIFIRASSKTGARPTKQANVMREFSPDDFSWEKIPSEILVTGSSGNPFLIIFDKLDIIQDQSINLWDYSLFNYPRKAIKISQRNSTVCCFKESSRDDFKKMKSNIREVLAIGRLIYPFSGWARQ